MRAAMRRQWVVRPQRRKALAMAMLARPPSKPPTKAKSEEVA